MTSAKYNNDPLTQALYEIAESSDERCGHTDYGFMALFLINEEWTIDAEDCGLDNGLVVDAGTYVTLREFTDGSTALYRFETDTDAQECFDEFFYHFAIWEEANGY